jgi:hypothetical protein
MKINLLFLAGLLACSIPVYGLTADSTPSADQTASPVASPIPTSTPEPENKFTRSPRADHALLIHKPMPSSSWGKVIQYRREEIFALSDKNREILHEFLFQDDKGVVRTAVFHENPSGDGYWEVTVWDLP